MMARKGMRQQGTASTVPVRELMDRYGISRRAAFYWRKTNKLLPTTAKRRTGGLKRKYSYFSELHAAKAAIHEQSANRATGTMRQGLRRFILDAQRYGMHPGAVADLLELRNRIDETIGWFYPDAANATPSRHDQLAQLFEGEAL